MIYADHHGWWTKIELRQKSNVHLEPVILKELDGKAIQLDPVQNANIRLTIVM